MRSLVPTNANDTENRSPMAFPWEADRLFDRLLGELWGTGQGTTGQAEGAPLEIVELDDAIEVAIEVPGIDPDELDISLTDQVLTIVAEKRDPSEERANHRTYSERHFGSLRRSVRLPCAVEADGVKAEHRHGVVTITLQKKDAVRPRRIRIEHA